ncbi:NACHT domain-containing protein [Nonomuraea salmonea]|uniref:NACHT domain-containing protein n=1 Tax=Nonomuraea salmonea TaxID=46181 RepID=A0ABV5NR75_9ACTN
MRHLLTYRDAVALLGGPTAISGLLDKGSSLALFGLGEIDLFDARAEAVRLGDTFLRRMRDKVKGLSRYDTTQRLTAAHTVIVMVAYLEALAETDVLRELTLDDQRRVLGTDGPLHLLADDLDLLAPGVADAYENVVGVFRLYYRAVTNTLLDVLAGLACWDRWDETTRQRLRDETPVRALRRYEELFRRMAAEFPEVTCWIDRTDHQATRAEVRKLGHGLAGIERRLAALPQVRGLPDRLTALITSNRAALRRPMMSSTRTPPGMTLPLLEQGYVDPKYRLHPNIPFVSAEEVWAQVDHRDDLTSFLAAYLTQPLAAEAPLLVLGQPGAGKSVLTRVLAARLPASEFLALRVELRGVPADADVLAQIEYGIRAALDEDMSWPDFVHAGGGALPVVMLDGFDELLQATGVNQSDYLERVAEFQRTQAEKGRALAVIVTSRTAVADRARVPENSYVIRLEPFDEDQIEQWVTVWNKANQAYFRDRDLQPMPLERVLAVPKLAGQPLLLSLLALYDADANALRLMREDLPEAELYERLLHGFAAREVAKTRPGLPDDELERAVEDELLRLSVTAFAMFNRGRQWIADADLDADLHVLLPDSPEKSGGSGFRRRLTQAEGVIGGFFFIHTTQALRDHERLRTYEFLHATFGEYLVARLVARELADMAEQLAFAESRRRPATPDDGFLHALLSFAALAGRAPTVDFLAHRLTSDLTEDRREILKRHLCELFARALQARPGSAYDAYQPTRADVTARCAAHAANLMLLAVLTADGPVTGAGLFGSAQPEQANELWRRMTRLWHSQLTRAEWDALIRTVKVRHELRDGVRTLEVTFERDAEIDVADLVFFTWPGEGPQPARRMRSSGSIPMREIAFRDDTLLGHLYAALLPYAADVDPTLESYPRSPVALLLDLLLSETPDTGRYAVALAEGPTWKYVDQVLRRLAEDARVLPGRDVLTLMRTAARRWSGPDRLQRIHEVLSARPDVDERVKVQAGLIAGQAEDEPRLRPFDGQLSAVLPRDVPGDRQP